MALTPTRLEAQFARARGQRGAHGGAVGGLRVCGLSCVLFTAGACFAAQYNDRMSLPSALYSVAQVRAFDARAIATQGVTGYALMQRAGEAALRALRAALAGGAAGRRSSAAAATTAATATCWRGCCARPGWRCSCMRVVDPARLGGDARRACDDFLAARRRAAAGAAAGCARTAT